MLFNFIRNGGPSLWEPLVWGIEWDISISDSNATSIYIVLIVTHVLEVCRIFLKRRVATYKRFKPVVHLVLIKVGYLRLRVLRVVNVILVFQLCRRLCCAQLWVMTTDSVGTWRIYHYRNCLVLRKTCWWMFLGLNLRHKLRVRFSIRVTVVFWWVEHILEVFSLRVTSGISDRALLRQLNGSCDSLILGEGWHVGRLPVIVMVQDFILSNCRNHIQSLPLLSLICG